MLDEAGIAVSGILAWNACPWYINRAPRAAELEAGVEPLRRPCALLPELRVEKHSPEPPRDQRAHNHDGHER